MKVRLHSALFLTALFLGTTTFLPGCATTGTERATKTTSSMQMVENDYREAAAQIDVTNASLEELTKLSQADLKKAYNTYSDNVKKMEKLGKQLDTHTEKMSKQGSAYFADWEKSSYANPEISEISERRRVEMREAFTRIPAASIGVKGTLKSYLTDIKDIQKYLSNDLTPQGIESIRPIAQTAVQDGDKLKEAIRPVLAEIDSVKAEMTQGGGTKK